MNFPEAKPQHISHNLKAPLIKIDFKENLIFKQCLHIVTVFKNHRMFIYVLQIPVVGASIKY